MQYLPRGQIHSCLNAGSEESKSIKVCDFQSVEHVPGIELATFGVTVTAEFPMVTVQISSKAGLGPTSSYATSFLCSEP